MSRRRHLILLPLISTLIVAVPEHLHAAWPADGLPVCTADGTQSDLVVVGDDHRGLFLVWLDTRSGTERIYAQRVDADGNPAWTENGVPVGSGTATQSQPSICSDRSNGLWIAWTEASGVYVQHLNETGTPDFTGGTYPNAMGGTNSGIVCDRDGSGGVIVAWINSTGGYTGTVWTARINSGGTWDPGWMQVGDEVWIGEDLKIHTNAPPGGGVLLAWIGSMGGWAQWVDDTLTPRWNGSTGHLVGATDWIDITDRQSPDGGAYVTYVSPGVTYYISVYVLPISAAGVEQGLLGVDTIDAEWYDFAGVEVVDNGEDGLLCTWGVVFEPPGYPPQYMEAIYAKNYDYDYSLLWGPIELPGTTTDYIDGWTAFLKRDTGDLFVGWQEDVSSVGRLHYSTIDRATGVAEDDRLVPGSHSDGAPRLCSSFQLVPQTNEHPMAAWIDERNPSDDIYANSLSADWPDTNVIGLYVSDDPAVAADWFHGAGSLDLYLCVKDYRQSGGITGWECVVDLPPNVTHMSTTLFGGAFNYAAHPEYVVVGGSPLPVDDFIVLARISVLVTDGTSGLVYLRPRDPTCIPGELSLLADDDPYVCRVMEVVSGDPDEPVFYLNDPVVGVESPAQPALRLHANAPNPFNPRTTIRYDLPRATRVNLKVHDLAGRVVRVLRERVLQPEGRHEVVWEGRDDAGREVPAGVYLYRLQADGKSASGRMVLVR
jgi:hypothetical protein